MNAPDQDVRPRLGLLIAQGVALGTTASLLVITANALFLPAYGAQTLPYVYLVVAVLGSALAYSSAALQRRFVLPQIALAVTGGLAVFWLAAWLLAAQRWVSFALIACFPLLLQLGFIFLGGQAGRLLDVRQIKRHFPQIVAGFVGGFVLGAFLAPLLLDWVHLTEHLIAAVSVSGGLLFGLIWVTYRRYRPLFTLAAGGAGPAPAGPGLRSLLRQRFVRLIVGYQFLYAVVNQLSDYLLAVQAGARYTHSADIASFFSTFTVALNATDLFMLLVVAGVFLTRYGLNAGLTANPLVTAGLYLAAAAAGVALGPASTVFFLLIVTARIANISVADAATRGSVNAAYQALPAHEQALAQTAAEGLGAPLALGLVGLALLAFNALQLSTLQVVVITAAAALVWAALGAWVYREYGGALLRAIKRRHLPAADLTLPDRASRQAVLGLVQSENPADVRLALEWLAGEAPAELQAQVRRLLSHPQPAVRAEAAARLAQAAPAEAAAALTTLLDTDPDPAVRAAALRALCAAAEGEAVEAAQPFLTAAEPDVQLAALAGLLRHGGIPGILAAGQRLTQLAASAEAGDRQLAARAIGAVGQPAFYQPLQALLADPAASVRQAALAAAGQLQHPRLLPGVAANLVQVATRSAALAALVAYGPAALPLVARALAEPRAFDPATRARLIRAGGQIGGDAAGALLIQHLHEPDPEVRTQILAALNACGFKAAGGHAAAFTQAVEREAQMSLQLLAALAVIPDGPAPAALRRAVQDELDLARQRLFWLLACRYDREAVLRAAEQARAGHALALEMLDVALAPADRGVVLALANPALPAAQRLQQLAKTVGRPVSPPVWETLLPALIANADGAWMTWTRACAIYAAGQLRAADCRPTVQAALTEPEPVLQETAGWALARLA